MIVANFFLIIFLEYWCSLAIGYIISFIIERKEHSQVTCIALATVLTILSGAMITLTEFKNLGFPLNALPSYCYLRYGLESLYLFELDKYSNLYDITKSHQLLDYNPSNMYTNWKYLLIIGIILRVISFILLYLNKPNSYLRKLIVLIMNIAYFSFFACSIMIASCINGTIFTKCKENVESFIYFSCKGICILITILVLGTIFFLVILFYSHPSYHLKNDNVIFIPTTNGTINSKCQIKVNGTLLSSIDSTSAYFNYVFRDYEFKYWIQYKSSLWGWTEYNVQTFNNLLENPILFKKDQNTTLVFNIFIDTFIENYPSYSCLYIRESILQSPFIDIKLEQTYYLRMWYFNFSYSTSTIQMNPLFLI